MNWKKILLVAVVALGFAFAATPRSEARVFVNVGLGFPGFYGGYPGPYYYGYGYAPYGYYYGGPGYSYRRPYYWYRGQRVYYGRRYHRHIR